MRKKYRIRFCSDREAIEEHPELGVKPDWLIARDVQCSVSYVSVVRRKIGVKAWMPRKKEL